MIIKVFMLKLRFVKSGVGHLFSQQNSIMKTILLTAIAALFTSIYPYDRVGVISSDETIPLTPKGEPKEALPSDNLADTNVFGSPLGVRGGVRGTAFLADSTLPAYKTKVIRDVFNQLKNAKGDFRSRRPYLQFVKVSDGGPAVAYPKSGLIVVEEKAYDICASFGKDSLNALAHILSHELVHCYEKHDWEEFFAHAFSATGIGNTVNDDALADEIQADYLGGFLAYQAGFATFGIAPKFLDKVYEKYDLKDEQMTNYPPKEERKTMATTSEQKLKDLLELFEVGNFLVALEEYDDALGYYLKVVEDFQSREVYNNVGVLLTLSAMKLFTPLENIYAYPIELDVQSRLRTGSRGDNKKELREQKLMEALDYFEKARQYDAFYPVAHLNEGCAHALLGLSQKDFSELEWEDAEVAARRAIRLSTDSPDWKNTLTDAHVLLGILSALQKDSTSADGHFMDALKLDADHFLAKANQNTLKGIKNETKPSQEIDLTMEVIDDTPFNTIKLDKSHVKGQIIKEEQYEITLAARAYVASQVFANAVTTGTGGQKVKKNTFLQMTGTGYGKATEKGIKLGDSLTKVLEKYGEPQARFNLSSGTMLRYKNKADFSGLIFQFDKSGQVMRWVIFRQVR
jgi:tetratricopeptide (TPR) repeat protein